jgi:hypothetical protein
MSFIYDLHISHFSISIDHSIARRVLSEIHIPVTSAIESRLHSPRRLGACKMCRYATPASPETIFAPSRVVHRPQSLIAQ